MKNIRGAHPIVPSSWKVAYWGRWLLVSVCFIAWNDSHAEQQSTVPSIVMAQPGSQGYAVGSLNGVRVRIPAEYQFFGVQYEGENAFNQKTWRKTPATLDTPITTYSILLRASNFEPRRTPQDHKDWVVDGHYIGPETRWFSVGVYPDHKPDDTPQLRVSEWRIRLIESWKVKPSQHDAKTSPQLHYGLQLDEPVLRSGSPKPYWPEILIYTTKPDSPLQTLIHCQPPSEKDINPLWRCEQNFDVKNARAGVKVRYQIDQLPRWQEIQTKISAIVNSFVVQEKNAVTSKQVPAAHPTIR